MAAATAAATPGDEMTRSRGRWLKWLEALNLTQTQIGPMFEHSGRQAQRWAADPELIPKAVWLLVGAMVELGVERPEDVLTWIKANK